MSQLLKQSQSYESHSSGNLFQNFCEHLEQMSSKRRLLIEPDFMKCNKVDEGKKPDVLSSRDTKQSNKEQTKPLIEVISQNPTNVEKIEEPEALLVDPEDPTMDAALKDKILKSISAPKSEEEREEARKSADKLMRISREAMAKGKSLLDQPYSVSKQETVSIEMDFCFIVALLTHISISH